MDISAFKDGALEVYSYAHHGRFDDGRMQKLEAAIRGVRIVCDDPGEYLEAAFTHLYPTTTLDVALLQQKVDEELALVARIRNKDTLSKPELDRIGSFCAEMWSQLQMYENGALPFK